jgi:hypothetical protein
MSGSPGRRLSGDRAYLFLTDGRSKAAGARVLWPYVSTTRHKRRRVDQDVTTLASAAGLPRAAEVSLEDCRCHQ